MALADDRPVATERPLGDVRMAATRAVRGAGFRYILAYNSDEGNGLLGAAMVGTRRSGAWRRRPRLARSVLFRIE
jgi:hypothetical protein